MTLFLLASGNWIPYLRSITCLPKSDYASRALRKIQEGAKTQKKKWHISCGNLTIGQMVMVKENNLPPLLWLLGRVTKLIPGKDGVARVAEVKTKKGHLLRACNRRRHTTN
ncbi:unnamed protein product [Parnassius mnemosyne]|uniref:DUF5641 domain-containing protein n=1 Tax=Parnassius mnemosyne TaxID=213953 RepID=A0AAV1KRE8_9NEOP